MRIIIFFKIYFFKIQMLEKKRDQATFNTIGQVWHKKLWAIHNISWRCNGRIKLEKENNKCDIWKD